MRWILVAGSGIHDACFLLRVEGTQLDLPPSDVIQIVVWHFFPLFQTPLNREVEPRLLLKMEWEAGS